MPHRVLAARQLIPSEGSGSIVEMSKHLTLAVLVTGAVLAVLSWTPTAHAALQGNVKIEQVSPSELGVWHLYTESGTTRTSKDAGVDPRSFSFGISEVGQMTLKITPPAGMSVRLSMERGGELKWTKESQQESFTLYPNDNYRFVIQYSMTKLGLLGITSEPSRIAFRIRGPIRRKLSGKTPKTILNLPAGSYTIYMASTPTCLKPAPHTAIVESGGRATAHLRLICNDAISAIPDRIRPSKRQLVEDAYKREQDRGFTH